MLKCFQTRILYLEKATKHQYLGGNFDEVEEKQPKCDYSSFFQIQGLHGIQPNYQATLKAKGNTFSAEHIIPFIQGEITD